MVQSSKHRAQLLKLHSSPEDITQRQKIQSLALTKEWGLEDFRFKTMSAKDNLKERLTQSELLGELLSDNFNQHCKISLPWKATVQTLKSGSKGNIAEQPSKPFNANAQAETPLKERANEADISTRWKRKRLVVPHQQNTLYMSSPEEAEGSPKQKARNGRNGEDQIRKGHHKAGRDKSAAIAQEAMKANAGFTTARAAFNAERRLNGKQGYESDDYTSGNMFQDGQHNTLGDAGKRPFASGLRRPYQAPNAARGGFVPPFAKKAMQDQSHSKDGQESVLSPKTLELLVGSDGELPELLKVLDPNILELVCNEVLDTRPGVSWDDIAGQDDAKSLIQELVVWPMLNPHLFTGARAPPKGLLLFGPPGTGKTLIGRAIASNINATFFNISASSLTSKWIGEGEKMVRALFAVAQTLQPDSPSIIFMDEIDSVLSARKSEGEHEASRRLKTELLVQMEGVNPSGTSARILLVGATNRPEELDEAARRRLTKQLYIPLPCDAARKSMLLRQLGPGCGVQATLPDTDLAKIVTKTCGYSGSDMRNLIQEACQGPVRDAVKHHGAGIAELSESDLRPVVLKDFQIAARAQRASVEPSEIVRYEEYHAKHGARYIQQNASGISEDEEDW